jgi:hypothetical protein
LVTEVVVVTLPVELVHVVTFVTVLVILRVTVVAVDEMVCELRLVVTLDLQVEGAVAAGLLLGEGLGVGVEAAGVGLGVVVGVVEPPEPELQAAEKSLVIQNLPAAVVTMPTPTRVYLGLIMFS